MRVNRRSQGRVAEDAAAEYLLALGYTIVTRRYKSKRGEIDLVAIDSTGGSETLVFIEVKSRSRAGRFPERAVDWTKRSHFAVCVEEYLSKTGQPQLPGRYDVIAVDPDGIQHFVDAFRAGE